MLVTLALTMEPVARRAVGMLPPEPLVWGMEVAIGAIAAIAFAWLIATGRRSRRAVEIAD